jgi:hypothetical protein
MTWPTTIDITGLLEYYALILLIFVALFGVRKLIRLINRS